MSRDIKFFLEDQSGVTAIEYGILAAAMAAAIGLIFGADGEFVGALKRRFKAIGDQISGTPAGTGAAGSGSTAPGK